MLNHSQEVWKEPEGYEGFIQVSNTGKVRSIRTNHGKYQERELKQRIRSKTCPYLQVQITKHNVSHKEFIHRLVAKTFVPNPNNKPQVNHIDGNKLNNDAYNLEWVTCSENHKHAYTTNLREAPRASLGKKCGGSSKFHNVTWDTSRQKWKASLKHEGKLLFQKRFDSEIEAALHVNVMLDELGFTDRPRNDV